MHTDLTQIQIQTAHHLHLSDQQQDCHYVVNAHSNRNVFGLRLNALWNVKSCSSVGSSFQALGLAYEKHLLCISCRVSFKEYTLMQYNLYPNRFFKHIQQLCEHCLLCVYLMNLSNCSKPEKIATQHSNQHLIPLPLERQLSH